MDKEFINKLFITHQELSPMPPRSAICKFTEGLLELLFPQLSEKQFINSKELEIFADSLVNDLRIIFMNVQSYLDKPADQIVDSFFGAIPEIYDMLMEDAQAIHDGDPAAKSRDQVIRTYPGFLAIACYRIGHGFCQIGVPLIPRILTEYAHSKTGIDIHPKANIGRHFCIDHGTGIVIGETTNIGNDVKIYQGVTLGALSVKKEMAKIKRHPTIEDNVVIYAGATILGGSTVIGKNSIIGGNVWLTESIPPNSRVYHKSQIEVRDGIKNMR
jgi:serine O-acetyltransferase